MCMPSLIVALLCTGLIASLASMTVLPTSLPSRLSHCCYCVRLLTVPAELSTINMHGHCDIIVGDRGAFLASHCALCHLAIVA